MTRRRSICPPLPNDDDYNLYQPHRPYYCPTITDNAHCLHWQTINYYAFLTPLKYSTDRSSTETMNNKHYQHRFNRTLHDKLFLD